MRLDELHALIEHLPQTDSAVARDTLGPLLADWTPGDENLAMTVDALRNWLQFLWSQWTATEAERKRRVRGRAARTPPLLPYAVRPEELTELHREKYEIETGAKPREVKPGQRGGMRPLSIEELARLV